MKTIKYAVAALALTTLSFGAFAAESVTAAQANSMNKIGVVSAEGATTLDGLEARLAAKAEAAGATGYTITSANTNNKLSGTAVIYKYPDPYLCSARRFAGEMFQPSLTLLLFFGPSIAGRAFF